TAGLVVLLAIAAAVPLAKNVTVTHVGVFVLLYVGAAVAWNIFSGFTGYISLGAAVFFGVGVYTVALLSKHLNLAGAVVFAPSPGGRVGAGGGAGPVGVARRGGPRAPFRWGDHPRLFLLPAVGPQFRLDGRHARDLPAVPQLGSGHVRHALLLHGPGHRRGC